MSNRKVKAWYFSNLEKRLRFDDNREISAGIIHHVNGPIVMCQNGLHGSIKTIDALEHAPGPYVWRVELGGEIRRDRDKLAGGERTYLWGYDATDVLQTFSRRCALDVVHLWDCPGEVLAYLKTGDNERRRTAWMLAQVKGYRWYNTRVGRAAESAVSAAVWATTENTPQDTARHAALTAVWAQYAANHNITLRKKQEDRLYRMLLEGKPQ